MPIKKAGLRGKGVFDLPLAMQIARNRILRLRRLIPHCVLASDVIYKTGEKYNYDDYITHLFCAWIGRHLNDAVQKFQHQVCLYG